MMADLGYLFLQGNLKAFTGKEQPSPLFNELALLLSEEHQQLEHLSLQLLFNQWNSVAGSVQLHTPSLGIAFPVS